MSSNRDFDREVTFEIVEEIGVIAAHSTGWKKELNLVSWNGGPAKYDIRDWDPDHNRMSRGVTLKEQEMRQIVELLRRRRPHRRDREREEGVMMDAPSAAAESFAEAPVAPAAAMQGTATARLSEGSLHETLQETAEPQHAAELQHTPELQHTAELQHAPESQHAAESQEMAAAREMEDDFPAPEAHNLESAVDSACACCS